MAEKTKGCMTLGEFTGKVEKTIQGKFYDSMFSYVLGCIKKNTEDNIEIITNNLFSEIEPQYRLKLLNLYNATFGLVDGVNDIPDDIKVSQAALLDSVLYSCDVGKGVVDLCTMNPGMFLPEMQELPPKVLKSIMDKNKLGQMKYFRIELEHDPTNEDVIKFELKDGRKVITDNNPEVLSTGEGVVLIPLTLGICYCSALSKALECNSVLKVAQTIGDSTKVRCISLERKVLAKYCDSKQAVEDVKAKFYPLKGFFYAPVLGAPSTSSMVTNINIFNLDSVNPVTDIKEISALGIQKPVNPVQEKVLESTIQRSLIQLKNNNIEKFLGVLERLPNIEKVCSDVTPEDVTPAMLSNYIHTIKRADLKKIAKILKVGEDIETASEFMGEAIVIPKEDLTVEKVTELLKNNICNFLIQKKDFSLSSMLGTNNKEILSRIYGKDYAKYYESLGVRIHYAMNEYRGGNIDLEGILAKYNLDIKASILIERAIMKATSEGMSKEDAMEILLKETLGLKERAKADNDNITLRTLSAYLVKENKDGESALKSVDYYKALDLNKVVKAYVYK